MLWRIIDAILQDVWMLSCILMVLIDPLRKDPVSNNNYFNLKLHLYSPSLVFYSLNSYSIMHSLDMIPEQ